MDTPDKPSPDNLVKILPENPNSADYQLIHTLNFVLQVAYTTTMQSNKLTIMLIEALTAKGIIDPRKDFEGDDASLHGKAEQLNQNLQGIIQVTNEWLAKHKPKARAANI